MNFHRSAASLAVVAFYGAALAANPDLPLDEITARARRADRAGAFTALRNALLLDGRRAQTHLALGKLLFDTGWVDDALRCFARAVALDPTLARPYPAEDGGQD